MLSWGRVSPHARLYTSAPPQHEDAEGPIPGERPWTVLPFPSCLAPTTARLSRPSRAGSQAAPSSAHHVSDHVVVLLPAAPGLRE